MRRSPRGWRQGRGMDEMDGMNGMDEVGVRVWKRLELGRVWLLVAGLAVAAPCWGAEQVWDFGATRAGEAPAGFRSAVTGEGRPGEWRVVEVTADSAAPERADGDGASLTPRQAVLAQLARDATDEHFPLLVWEEESFGDFTFRARVRVMEGELEQMAGLAFRIRDERNYYVLRLSVAGGTVRFYKFVDGVRSLPIGVDGALERRVWYELAVECKGNQIRCLLDGRELFPVLTDNSFTDGRVGFWSKSDSVAQFANARVVYVPRDPLGVKLVQDGMAAHGRLVGLRVCAAAPGTTEVRVVGSSVEGERGAVATESEASAAREGAVFYGKEKGVVTVILPLNDRNGEPVASVRVRMDSFPGQTQDNALARARPIVARMQARVKAVKDLFE